MASRSRPVPEVVILAVAVLVRVAWLVANGHLALANDPADYQRLAVSLAGGHGFGTTVVAPGGGPTAFRPPLWPLFLAGLYWLVGVHVMVARAVEVVLGVLTVGLIGVLARQLWSRRPALGAMAVAAIYPPFLLAGGSLLSESLSLPLELGSLSAALAARRSARPVPWVLAAGVACGLDILCRPDSFVLLLPVALLAGARPLGAGRFGRTAAPALVVGLAVLTVLPWLVRDAAVMGRFVPVTTQGGLVASGTYNDTAADDPVYPAQWRPTSVVPEYQRLLRRTEVEEEAALRRASLHFISEHPLYPLRVSGWNLLRLFDLTGLSDPRSSWASNGYGAGYADLDAVGLAVLAALGLVGAAGAVIRPSSLWRYRAAPGSWPLWLAPFLVTLVTIPVLGESRLRVGVDPFLVLAAVPGLWVMTGHRHPASHATGPPAAPPAPALAAPPAP